MAAHKTVLSWSTGKDAALALYYLRNARQYAVEHLFTTVNAHHNRVSMHGLRRSMLEAQVAAIGLPHSTLELPRQPNMEEYSAALHNALLAFGDRGFTHCAYGDIFLEDLRIHREQELFAANIEGVFPLWKRDTRTLLKEFVNLGFKAVVVSCNGGLLDQSFAGREVDHHFLADLPPSLDACGENGEFHTFCYDGPVFQHAVAFERGECVYQEYKAPRTETQATPTAPIGFWFRDLIPI